MDLNGAVALVTGGASGLARRTVEHFVNDKGARVAVLDIDDAGGAALVRTLGEDRVGFWHADVADEAAVAQAVRDAARRFGRLDVCINAAAAPGPMTILDSDKRASNCASFARTIRINLIGTFNVMAHCIEEMAKNRPGESGERGVVINVVSIAAFDGQHGQVAYSASKAGVVGMSLPAARDLSSLGIRINSIAPGLFLTTPMAQSLGDKVLNSLKTMVEFPKRSGDPLEFALLCAHICENGFLNAENIRLDGAVRLRPR